jgi:LysM repeat protein
VSRILSAPKPNKIKSDDRTKSRTIKKDETLSKISRDLGVPISQLLKANPQLKNPDQLKAGALLFLPESAKASQRIQKMTRASQSSSQDVSKFESAGPNSLSQSPKGAHFGHLQSQTKSPEGQNLFAIAGEAIAGKTQDLANNLKEAAQLIPKFSESVMQNIPKQFEHAAKTIGKTKERLEGGMSSFGNAAQQSHSAFLQASKNGKAPHEALQAGIGAYTQSLYNQTIDRWLDQSVLGPDTAAQDKATGVLAPLLTNRLGVGESVNIEIANGSTLPTELLGAPNLTLEQGGRFSIKRVAALDENNKAILNEKTGKPETRLEVDLQMNGRQAADYRAEIGFEAKGAAFGHKAGIEAKASAKLEAGVTGQAGLRMRFDPDNPKEMSRLNGLMGAVAAVQKPSTLSVSSLGELGQNVESIYGDGGLYAQAIASASARAGIFKDENKSHQLKPENGTKGQRNFLKRINNQIQEKSQSRFDELHQNILKKLHLDIASVSASLGGNVNVGKEQNFRTGENKLSIEIGGRAGVSASVFSLGGGKKSSAEKRLELIFGKSGELSNIHLKRRYTKETFLASRAELESMYGKTITDGFLAKLSKSKSIEIQFDMKPSALNAIKNGLQQQDADSVLRAAHSILSDKVSRRAFRIEPSGIVATSQQNATIQGNIGIAILAKLGLSGILSLGHEQESTPTGTE